jgi:hypothetical protein
MRNDTISVSRPSTAVPGSRSTILRVRFSVKFDHAGLYEVVNGRDVGVVNNLPHGTLSGASLRHDLFKSKYSSESNIEQTLALHSRIERYGSN